VKSNHFLFTLLIISVFASCTNTSKKPDVDFKQVLSESDISIDSFIGGKLIFGDFLGNATQIGAWTQVVREGMSDSVSHVHRIYFMSGKIQPLELTSDQLDILMINEGDLNADGSDELSVYTYPNHGCTNTLTTYSLKNGKWHVLMSPLLVPTFCETISHDALQNRIFVEQNEIYKMEVDLNSEDMKLVKVRAEFL